MKQPTLFHWKKLEEFAAELFIRTGVPRHHAEKVAESLIHADLRGIESHGISRLPIYIERIMKKLIEPANEEAIIADHGGMILLDGQNQLGAVVGRRALAIAMERARQTGIAAVGVRNSNHFGACSYYAEKAIGEGMILLVFSNAPQTMAPIGGTRPFFGSNPLAIGIPAGQEPSFLLDMATTVVARGKIALAAKKGEAIPEGLALDASGVPTTDPAAALLGSILPIGGPKGYGIAMFIDILTGLLTGAGYGESVYSLYDNWEHPQNVGHVFLAINIGHFLPREIFIRKMDDYIRQIKAVPRREGVEEIFIPGELEYRSMLERKKTGIPLTAPVIRELSELGESFQLDLFNAAI